MTTTPTHDLLGAVVEGMWETMLRAPVVPWPGPWPAGLDGLLAEVRVDGDWRATVRAWCPVPTAEHVAGTLLRHAGAVGDPDREDAEDALGELVNVVAGSVKGALGGSSQLGLPEVREATAPDADPTAPHLLLEWQHQPFLITIDRVS